MEDFLTFTLIKFGQKDHIYDLYENGTTYMNSIQYFIEYEGKDKLRGDKDEGIDYIENYPKGTPLILKFQNGYELKPNDAKLTLRQHSKQRTGNLFCLYSITSREFSNNKSFRIDKRNKRFGTHGLVIFDVKEFLKRLRREIRNQGMISSGKYVEYLDYTKYTGNITVFNKSIDYSYQNEYRIYVKSDNRNAIKFCIGDIKDISNVFSMQRLINEEILLVRKY